MKNYVEKFVVMQQYFYNNYPSAIQLSPSSPSVQTQNKDFNTYEAAVEYIDDMLKHHDIQFSITKVFSKNI